MNKLLLLILLSGFFLKDFAQTSRTSISSSKDSTQLLKADDPLKDVLSDDDSYFNAGFGIGNSLFSARNTVLKSKQSSARTLIYSPTISYFNKSGFNITAGASLLKDTSTGFGVNQYILAPGYELQNDQNIDFSIVYTHYFVTNKYSNFSSPIQNDLYTNITYKKPWLKPGIAIDFSNGEYKDETRKTMLYDSSTNKLKVFSFIASVAHGFNWTGLFTKEDNFLLTSSLLFNAGSNNLTIYHNTNASNQNERNILQIKSKKSKFLKLQNTKFAPQSFGIDMDGSYTINKFTIEPEIYLDYYLPKTIINRLTSVFSLSLLYRF